MPSEDPRIVDLLNDSSLFLDPQGTNNGGKSVTRITRTEVWEIEKDFEPRDAPRERFWIKVIDALGRAIAHIVGQLIK